MYPQVGWRAQRCPAHAPHMPLHATAPRRHLTPPPPPVSAERRPQRAVSAVQPPDCHPATSRCGRVGTPQRASLRPGGPRARAVPPASPRVPLRHPLQPLHRPPTQPCSPPPTHTHPWHVRVRRLQPTPPTRSRSCVTAAGCCCPTHAARTACSAPSAAPSPRLVVGMIEPPVHPSPGATPMCCRAAAPCPPTRPPWTAPAAPCAASPTGAPPAMHRLGGIRRPQVPVYGHVRCTGCSVTLMFPTGARSVKCSVCHMVTPVTEQPQAPGAAAPHAGGAGPSAQHQQQQQRPQQPPRQTVVVENPAEVDAQGNEVRASRAAALAPHGALRSLGGGVAGGLSRCAAPCLISHHSLPVAALQIANIAVGVQDRQQ